MAYALATSLASPASSTYDGIHGATLVGSMLYLAAESSAYGYPVVSVDLTGWTATTPVSGYTPVGSGGTNGRVDWILASPLGDRIYVGNNGELHGDHCLPPPPAERAIVTAFDATCYWVYSAGWTSASNSRSMSESTWWSTAAPQHCHCAPSRLFARNWRLTCSLDNRMHQHLRLRLLQRDGESSGHPGLHRALGPVDLLIVSPSMTFPAAGRHLVPWRARAIGDGSDGQHLHGGLRLHG